MAVKDYSTNPDENTSISGINIAEGCPPSGINNAIRQLMADVKVDHDAQESTNTELAKVMTGATADAAGTAGLAPVAEAGKQNKPLTGGGNYADSLDCDITGHASKDLPMTGGDITGPVSVPSVFKVLPGEDQEEAEIQLYPVDENAERIVGIDNFQNNFRAIFYGSKDGKLPLITFEVIPDGDKRIKFDEYNVPLSLAPSGRYIDIGYRASYTAPADGFISYRCTGIDKTEYVIISSKLETSSNFGAYGTGFFAGYIPIRKGDGVIMNANITGGWVYVRFTYAEGSY